MARSDFAFIIDEAEWAEVIAMAQRLPAEIGQNAFSKAVNEGLDRIMNVMKANLAVDVKNPTGMLEKSLMKKRKRKYEPTFWHGSIAVNVGKKRGDGAFYWHMVEHGHRVVTPKKVDTGKRVRAMQFALHAFETTKDNVTSNFTLKTKSELTKAWNKKAKNYSKVTRG